MKQDKILLSVPEAARHLGIGRSFLYEMLMHGRIASVRVGRRRLVPVRALETFVAQRLKEEGYVDGVAADVKSQE